MKYNGFLVAILCLAIVAATFCATVLYTLNTMAIEWDNSSVTVCVYGQEWTFPAYCEG